MKQLLIVILLCCFGKTFAQTNLYHPFPDSNATWNFDYTQAQCMFGFAFEEYSITMAGDTLINGELYQKLHIPFVDFYTLGSCDPFNTAGYKGAIRENEFLRKVYYIAPNDTEEQLLYDFTLEQGDTVKGVLSSFIFDPVIVESIDSVLVGNNYHKRWNINDWYGISVIEGVGSTYGLINATPGYITDAHMFILNCFQRDAITQYPDPSLECMLITSQPSFNPGHKPVKIFPNPSSGCFQVVIEPSLSYDEVRIITLQGNVVSQQKRAYHDQITVSGIAAGIYILQVIENKQLRIAEKILIYPGK